MTLFHLGAVAALFLVRNRPQLVGHIRVMQFLGLAKAIKRVNAAQRADA